ncbi:MAG: Type prenyl endopeptidase Rce1-like [Candidatus Sumerlaeota bacterium]|nr:Type prenyl endopeptidase Rce1-like [Candidatus Sumerlaeota bacterium]
MTFDILLTFYRAGAGLLYLGVAAAVALAGVMFAASHFGEVRRTFTWGHWIVAGGTLAVQFLVSAAAVVLLVAEAIKPATAVLVFSNWLVVLMALAAYPLGVWLEDRHRANEERKPGELAAILGWTVLILVWSFGSMLTINAFVEVKEAANLSELLMSPVALLAFLPIALLAPFVEEILFRLGVQGVLEEGCRRVGISPMAAIIVTSLLFAFGHAGMVTPDGAKELQIFGVGLILGWLKWRHGFRACVAGHMGLNLTSVVLQVLLFVFPESFTTGV